MSAEIDPQGRVLGHEIAETVIRVDRRMTYTAVNAIVTDRDEKTMEEYAGFVVMFDLMKELAWTSAGKSGASAVPSTLISGVQDHSG
ncbi:MAG: hypothetical protein ACLUD2_12055 [Clostridium sp.]